MGKNWSDRIRISSYQRIIMAHIRLPDNKVKVQKIIIK